MAASPERFALILTEAVHKIRLKESKTIKKTIRIIQDELGYVLGREGGSSIEYWRKGYIPATMSDVETLAKELVQRGGLNREALIQFLQSADYPRLDQLVNWLYPLTEQTGLTDDPQTIDNLAPFVVGPPISYPRQFFGREAALKRIFNLWKRFPLQNVAVVGLHRTGKTSLLHHVSHITMAHPLEVRPGQKTDWLPQPERYRWVFVDFQDPRMGNRERLLRHILTALELPVPTPCDLNNFMDMVSEYHQRPAIILMDEIGAGLASPELDQQFWWSLRSLSSNYSHGLLGFLLTAHATPALLAQEYGKPSPFFNIFGHIINLGPISETAARNLIASSPHKFTAVDTTWILEQSQGWPVLLQILSDACLAAMEEHKADWHMEALQRIERFNYLLTQ